MLCQYSSGLNVVRISSALEVRIATHTAAMLPTELCTNVEGTICPTLKTAAAWRPCKSDHCACQSHAVKVQCCVHAGTSTLLAECRSGGIDRKRLGVIIDLRDWSGLGTGISNGRGAVHLQIVRLCCSSLDITTHLHIMHSYTTQRKQMFKSQIPPVKSSHITSSSSAEMKCRCAGPKPSHRFKNAPH
jgi:hypothetical protein